MATVYTKCIANAPWCYWDETYSINAHSATAILREMCHVLFTNGAGRCYFITNVRDKNIQNY